MPDPNRPLTLTWRTWDRLSSEIVATIRSVKDSIVQRIDAQEKRIAALEGQPRGCSYGGVYQAGESYEGGVLCTRSGGLWLSTRPTSRVPGTCDDWKLICKEGEAR